MVEKFQHKEWKMLKVHGLRRLGRASGLRQIHAYGTPVVAIVTCTLVACEGRGGRLGTRR